MKNVWAWCGVWFEWSLMVVMMSNEWTICPDLGLLHLQEEEGKTAKTQSTSFWIKWRDLRIQKNKKKQDFPPGDDRSLSRVVKSAGRWERPVWTSCFTHWWICSCLWMKSKSSSLFTSKCKSLHYLLRSRRESRAAAAALQASSLRRSHGLHLFFTACGDAGSSICGSAAPPVSGFTVPPPRLPPPLSANTPLKKKPLPVYSVAAGREATRHLWKVNLVNVTIRATTLTIFLENWIKLRFVCFFNLHRLHRSQDTQQYS